MLKGMKWKVLFVLFFCFIAFCLGTRLMGTSKEALVEVPAGTPVGTGTPAGISAGGQGFQIEDGVLTAYTGNDVMVTVPEGVTKIGEEVFKESKIREVVLPVGVERIGDFAFYGCGELESVTLPEGVTVIGELAFYECVKLQNIVLPDTLKTIEFAAFGSSGLTDIALPSSMAEIGESAFSECRNLKSVQLPEQLEVIISGAFEKCYTLEEIIIPESVTQIGPRVFAYCYNLKKVVIYSDKIKKVGDYPFLFHAADRKVIFKKKAPKKYKQKFNYQDYITKGAVLYHKTSSSTVDMCAVKYTKKGKLAVPEKVGKYTVTGVKNIDLRMPDVINYRHEGITEVELADTITRLGDWVFSSALFTKIKFPANLTRIGNKALFGNHLEEIKLPEKLKYVGTDAFVRMYSVPERDALPEEGVGELPKSIVIPKSVQKIEDGNFGYYYTVYPVEGGDSWAYVKIDGYKVKGEKGSYAQEYAKKHGLKFVAAR